MKSLLLKSLYVLAALRYPRIRPDLRYFVRDNYFARLNQIRFWRADFLTRAPYKVIRFYGEFDQEIRYVLPFAYWHFLNGTLKQTIASKNTKPFYFFSPDHVEKYEKRVWEAGYGNYSIPNMTHAPHFDFSKWVRVPFKAHYQNNVFVYDKPLLIIANKYNIEWDKPPINFLDIPALDRLLSGLKSRYQVIYNRPLGEQIVHDNSEIMDLGEHAWLRTTHPDVLLMNDLFDQHRQVVENFNHLQLMVYANCNHFISMHGGTAALASCFGGTNILLSYPGGGFEHDFNEYETLFPALSGARILHAKSRDELLRIVEKTY
ncbi:hypothetical protein J2I47_03240 [Fibrella sp. HMF5335]|uniref:Uncharacterized protein n=1 Tax=Fibrella rubiginis TaxID=2817060 RepID=A0A939GDK1_9BACT|nr:hypothetical protein [Fibrella rubiginis]MBO0935555.1 hypothetical protein [Fibrella rubiginis]